jgi:hypothetical protein
MNPGFSKFLQATSQDRRDVFLSAAARLGTSEQNVEKDFWVTWTLDVLFNGLPEDHPRFLFKGGTSLSKGYPHENLAIVPYISREVPGLALNAEHVTTVVAERTFWDKIVILHGVRNWFDKRGVLRGEGQRVSRHYYDVHRICRSELGARAVADRALGADCVAHARMFFNSPDLGLNRAVAGTFSLNATDAMLDHLRRDYARMAGMIIGPSPPFNEVMNSVASLENELNP